MDPRHLGVGATPGSGGSGGQSVDASARRRRRMSAPLTGTRLMLAFNDAAGDGHGGRSSSSSSSSGGLDLSLDEPHPRYSHHRVYPEFSPMSNMGRLLFHGSPLGSPTTDDDVLVMDGVLVADGFSPGPKRYASFTDLRLVHTNSPGSGGSGRHGSSLQGHFINQAPMHGNLFFLRLLLWLALSGSIHKMRVFRKFSYGKESCVVQAMNPRHSEVELQRGRSVQSAGPNMQASPRTYHPSLQAAGVTTIPMRPPAAPYLTPPRAATTTTATATPARAQASFSWTPKRPESKAPSVQRATFAWPPTEEENASISQCLYGPRGAPQRRLPVFVSICPA
ncbi:hypothetical protein VPH35_065848 [Triticum aestivum]|uniref:uncharacterized protein isoform X1 n=1 Tax=Triticum aestivum TaxID=4565 RepID=UPI0008449F5F|nr:uncharacterized protein LOC123086006 isoform X1 [Triticum aestivum]XP_044363638.1 uncharacterized protein LOC123086006 isoform X1 [Triticum aestivum]